MCYIRTTILALITFGCLLGCKRYQAQERVTDALNPLGIHVPNGQSAVLDLNGSYAVIIPNFVEWEEIRYKVFVSTNGVFSEEIKPSIEGVAPAQEKVIIDSVTVLVGRTGEEGTTGVVLVDQLNATTGIGLAETDDLNSIDISQISFSRKRPFNPNDLLQAIGLDTNSVN